MSEWFYTKGGTRFGPIDFDDLQQLVAVGRVGDGDHVWQEGTEEWVRVRAVPELASSVVDPAPAQFGAPAPADYAAAALAQAAGNYATAPMPIPYHVRPRPRRPDGSGSAVAASWLLILTICGLALVPVIGFGVWLIAAPVLIVTFILGIVVIARGRTLHGVTILLVTMIGAPAFIAVGPFVGTMIGAAAVGAASEDATPITNGGSGGGPVTQWQPTPPPPSRAASVDDVLPRLGEPRPRVFGNGGNARTIAFCCDSSGSMIDKFSSLKSELAKAIEGLKPVQQFSIVFFADEKAHAFENGSLLSATPENKRKAYRWLYDLTTSGTSNPIPGLEIAFKAKPELMYILTDGDFPNNNEVLSKTELLNKNKKTRVNTIAFVTSSDDETSESFLKFLQALAEQNGGKFKHVAQDQLDK